MTMYLTLEAVNKGQLSLDDTVTMTNKEYIMSTLPELSNTKLYPGQVWTIADLLQITVSNSSNAAALILAKKVSKNTSDFVDLMNNKAKAIGMKIHISSIQRVLKIQDYVHLHQQSIKTKNVL